MTTSPSTLATRSTLRRARQHLLNLLFPPRCAGCRQRGAWLCDDCLGQISPLVPPLCARCGRPLPMLPHQKLCTDCSRGALRALDWARAAYPHSGAIRDAIHRFKYTGERARAEHLGPLLLPLLDQLDQPPAVALAPVPLNGERLRERGYNQAGELARVLAAARDLQLLRSLERTRATRPQVGLHRAERRDNVRGAFAWHGARLDDASVLLVDDVMTTGATADECAAALKAAGASWVGLVVVARAVGHDPDIR